MAQCTTCRPPPPRSTMLAYRHAFHAGNHADVLKHIVLMLLLRHMNLKEKGYRMVDTHAGAGLYALDSPQAQKKGLVLEAKLSARMTQVNIDSGEPAAVNQLLRMATAAA